MGVYDHVGNEDCSIQIKCTPDPCMHFYREGDFIDLKDGCYIGYEGAFIVKQERVIAVTEKIFDKYGGLIDPADILDGSNPYATVSYRLNALRHFGLILD